MKRITKGVLWRYRRTFWLIVGLVLSIWLLSIVFWRLVEVISLPFSP